MLRAGHVPDDTWVGANFGPSGIIGTHLVDIYYVMLHTKYQGSMPYGFRQEDFSMFSYISMCKTCGPMVII